MARPGVVRRRAAAPGGHPGGFGRVQGRRQVADAFGAQAGQQVLRRDDRAGEPDGGQLPGEVERGEQVDGGAVRLEQEPRVAIGGGGGGEQAAGGPQDGAGLAGHPQPAVRLAGPGQRAGGDRDAGAGLGRDLAAAAGEQEAGQRGGQHRAGSQDAGQLLERGGQVRHRAAVQGDGEDAKGGQIGQQRRAGPLADDGDGVGALGPVAEGRLQCLLLLRHRDRHGPVSLSPVRIVRIRTRFTCRRPGRVSNQRRCAW